MTDLSKRRKSRSAHRNAANKLVTKADDAMKEAYSDDQRLDVEVLLRTIKAKKELIQKLDNEVINLVEEDQFDEDIQEATDFELKLTKSIAVIERYLNTNRREVAVPRGNDAMSTPGVKLPKMLMHSR